MSTGCSASRSRPPGAPARAAWRDILVVGEQPARPTGHAYGFMNPHGYGGDRLRNVKRSLHAETIVTVLLKDWLRANGYLRTTSAVEATVAEAIAAGEA